MPMTSKGYTATTSFVKTLPKVLFRQGFEIINTGTGTLSVYIGSTALDADSFPILPGMSYHTPFYTGSEVWVKSTVAGTFTIIAGGQ